MRKVEFDLAMDEMEAVARKYLLKLAILSEYVVGIAAVIAAMYYSGAFIYKYIISTNSL